MARLTMLRLVAVAALLCLKAVGDCDRVALQWLEKCFMLFEIQGRKKNARCRRSWHLFLDACGWQDQSLVRNISHMDHRLFDRDRKLDGIPEELCDENDIRVRGNHNSNGILSRATLQPQLPNEICHHTKVHTFCQRVTPPANGAVAK